MQQPHWLVRLPVKRDSELLEIVLCNGIIITSHHVRVAQRAICDRTFTFLLM